MKTWLDPREGALHSGWVTSLQPFWGPIRLEDFLFTVWAPWFLTLLHTTCTFFSPHIHNAHLTSLTWIYSTIGFLEILSSDEHNFTLQLHVSICYWTSEIAPLILQSLHLSLKTFQSAFLGCYRVHIHLHFGIGYSMSIVSIGFAFDFE